MHSAPAPEMQPRGRFAYGGCLTVIVSIVAFAFAIFLSALMKPARAQSTSIVFKRDTVLLIAKMPQCTSACPDSIMRVWTVFGVRYQKTVKPRAVDTLIVLRKAEAATAAFEYVPMKTTRAVQSIPVTTLAVVAANGTYQTPVNIDLKVGDSAKIVARLKYPDGSVRAMFTPTTWAAGDSSMITLRPRGPLADSLWIVARSCKCVEANDSSNPPRLREASAGALTYQVRTPNGRWRPVTPLASPALARSRSD